MNSSTNTSIEHRHRVLVLIVSCVASHLIVSDVAMVNVALPSVVDGVRLTPAGVHWFVISYALAFSALPLLAGRISDRYGHVRVFAIGVAVFAGAAGVCGCARSPVVLGCARAVQGVGGAIIAATTLGLLTATFVDPAGRRRAFAAWSATVSGGAAAGVLLGGVLTADLSWRSVFFVDAALGCVCLVVTLATLGRRSSPVGLARRLDVTGGLLVTAGLALAVAGLSESSTHGWGSAVTLGLLSGGVLGLLLFAGLEKRIADPLVPVALLRRPGRLGTYAVTAIVGAVLYFMYLAISVYLQRVDGDGPLAAGVKSLPAALSVVAGALASTWVARRSSPRRQLIVSLAVVAVGFGWLSRLSVGAHYWTNLGLPLVVIGLGLGTSFVPATVIATAEVPGHRAGVASGLVNSSRQLGRAVGLAALSGLAVPAGHATAAAMAHSDARAFTICALAGAVGAVIAAVAIPRPDRAEVDPTRAADAVPTTSDQALT